MSRHPAATSVACGALFPISGNKPPFAAISAEAAPLPSLDYR
jgi:hypothetical protein